MRTVVARGSSRGRMSLSPGCRGWAPMGVSSSDALANKVEHATASELAKNSSTRSHSIRRL